MSHEIRTPLNSILGGVQLLRETSLLPEQRQPLELLAHSGDQLTMLLDDVLDLARIEAGHMRPVVEPFSLGTVLDSVQAALDPPARAKGLAFRV